MKTDEDYKSSKLLESTKVIWWILAAAGILGLRVKLDLNLA